MFKTLMAIVTLVFGKETHYRPLEKYGFDLVLPMAAMAVGRDPVMLMRIDY
jgi:hypothetical protein